MELLQAATDALKLIQHVALLVFW